MKEVEINRKLKSEARELGLCDKWFDAWVGKESKQELIEKYLRGIDFCIKHDWPSLAFVKENFERGLLTQNGVFVDENASTSNVGNMVLLGRSIVYAEYRDTAVGNIYVRHHSELEVFASDGARVFVEIYDGAKVHAVADDESRIFVYTHGGSVTREGNVTIRNREGTLTGKP